MYLFRSEAWTTNGQDMPFRICFLTECVTDRTKDLFIYPATYFNRKVACRIAWRVNIHFVVIYYDLKQKLHGVLNEPKLLE